eukprot:m.617833 g.617833  ORF g.617833 m.617833 type:complete len:126 (+) comp22522_c2_seq1:2304-2681(+)
MYSQNPMYDTDMNSPSQSAAANADSTSVHASEPSAESDLKATYGYTEVAIDAPASGETPSNDMKVRYDYTDVAMDDAAIEAQRKKSTKRIDKPTKSGSAKVRSASGVTSANTRFSAPVTANLDFC